MDYRWRINEEKSGIFPTYIDRGYPGVNLGYTRAIPGEYLQ